ncbi:hypothetical protein FHS22_003954 [Planomonospora venezuelensis]|uniref:Uncharacterized protein n=1 Tax=Planomonospora venezuelensis TaxID=1999 RepID=A0A841D4B8_PLAVE|nr:hypothetical protein [Planomonospora venezuelensis]
MTSSSAVRSPDRLRRRPPASPAPPVEPPAGLPSPAPPAPLRAPSFAFRSGDRAAGRFRTGDLRP